MSYMITAEEAQKLLDGTTPGPWEKMRGTHGRNKICATYPCINGLSALFTIADVNVPEESERGYTDDAFNPDVAAANAHLIAAAPDAFRTVIALHAQLATARAAQAMVVERAAEVLDAIAERHSQAVCDCAADGDRLAARLANYAQGAVETAAADIRALADTDGEALVRELRAERDDLSERLFNEGEAHVAVQADRDRLAAAEKELSDAYLRIRAKLQAWDTKPGGVDRFEVTEAALDSLIAANAALEAKVAALVGALKPFASVVKQMSQNHLNIEDDDLLKISGKDLLRAYDTLAEVQARDKGEGGE